MRPPSLAISVPTGPPPMTSASYEAAAEDRRRASRWARDAIMVAVQEIDAYRRVAYEEDTCSLVAVIAKPTVRVEIFQLCCSQARLGVVYTHELTFAAAAVAQRDTAHREHEAHTLSCMIEHPATTATGERWTGRQTDLTVFSFA